MPVQRGPGVRGTRLGLGELLGIGRVIERAGEAVGLDVTKCLERDAVADDLRLAIHVRWRRGTPRTEERRQDEHAGRSQPGNQDQLSGIEGLRLLVDAPRAPRPSAP